jgi:hypothetical protein
MLKPYIIGNPTKRKPILQVKILTIIATKGQLSISEAENLLKGQHNHPEIWQAFKGLETKNLIKNIHGRNPHLSKPVKRGRWKGYYIITETGLNGLINEGITPDKFWRAIIFFCYYHDNETTPDRIQELYGLYKNKYLKFPTSGGYSLQLDAFDELADDWFKNINKPSWSSRITADQKFIEILALNPGTTFENIASFTGKPVRDDEIKPILPRYSNEVKNSKEIGGYDEDIWHEQLEEIHGATEPSRESKSQFSLFITKGLDHNGRPTYELSLYGVLLMLTLVRYNDIGTLYSGLYYNLSVSEYFDRIASNYKRKLPLVFGKWEIVKSFLKLASIYTFDVILEKTVRAELIDESIFVRGYYNGNTSVASHSLKQFDELKSEGKIELHRLEDYLKGRILSSSDYDVNGKIIYFDDFDCKLSNIRNILGSLSKTELREKSLAEEVTLVYYLCLTFEDFFPDTLPTKCNLVRVSDSYEYNSLPLHSPIECLSQILKHDKEIEKHFHSQVSDVTNYQEELLDAMRELVAK